MHFIAKFAVIIYILSIKQNSLILNMLHFNIWKIGIYHMNQFHAEVFLKG
jgi:hypothetical protein